MFLVLKDRIFVFMLCGVSTIKPFVVHDGLFLIFNNIGYVQIGNFQILLLY